MRTSSEILAENQRLADLIHLQIMDTAPEKAFDDLLELLVQTTNCPIAMINFVAENRVWAKATKGIEIKEASREFSVCTYTIEQEGVTVVEDALADDRFSNNPYVVAAEGLRFYAGAPVYAPSGTRIGSVCILDTVAKPCTPAMQQALAITAQQVSALLELREKNKQLATWAKERLQLEQATIRRQIQQHEEERELIGYELHENFAQSIAASLQYLSLIDPGAEADKEQLTMVRQILTGVLKGVRQLSSAVFPIGSAGVIREEMFRQFVRQYNLKRSIEVSFICDGDAWQVPPMKLLTLFRIMVEQLHAYELQGNAAMQVAVTLTIANGAVQLDMTAESSAEKHAPDNEVVTNSIINRSHLQNGKVISHINEANNKVLSVQLPL